MEVNKMFQQSKNNENLNLKTLGEYLFCNNDDSDNGRSQLRDQIFLIEGKTGKQLKYGQLETQAHSLAMAMLNEYELNHQDICAIMSESCIEYPIIISACLLLNIPYTSIPPSYGPFNLGEQLMQTKPKCLFISAENYSKLKKLYEKIEYRNLFNCMKIIFIDEKPLDDSEPNSAAIQLNDLISMHQNSKLTSIPHNKGNNSIDDLVTIIFTSGSTGTPKGACHTHRSLLTNAIELKESEMLSKYRHQTMLLTFPLGHVSGNCLFFAALISQTPVVLLNYCDIELIFDVIKKYQCVQLLGSANIVNYLAKNIANCNDISTVKMVLTAGCKLPAKTAEILAEKHGIQISDAYGCTECLYMTSSISSKNVGKPFKSFEIKLIDVSTKKEIKDSSAERSGEICVRGPCVFREYYKKPDETKLAIDDDGWYHTGDVGYFDENGCLYITDRIKEIIKYKGYTVYPAEIESFLMTHDDVTGAVVIGVKHREYNQVSRAYVTVKPNSLVTVDQLQKFVNDNLGYSQRLNGGLLIVDRLPFNQMGKIDRRYFKELCSNEILDIVID